MLSRVVLVAALACSGCDAVFGVGLGTPDAPAARDLDGDGLFGADDNCPFVPNPSGADDDLDGIGNACDPHLTARDEVVMATWFADDTTGWTTSGTWTPVDGGVRSPDADSGGAMRAEVRRLRQPAIQVDFTIVAFDTTTLIKEVELRLDDGTNIGDCMVRRHPTASSVSQIVVHSPEVDYRSDRVMPEYEPGQRHVVTYVRELDSRCHLASFLATAPDIAEVYDTAPAIVLDNVQVDLHHVTVYQVSDDG